MTNEAYRAHERVEDADGECGAACKRLRHIELRVRVIVVILV